MVSEQTDNHEAASLEGRRVNAASHRYGVGDQVKIVAPSHPWKGAIGIIRAPFKAAGLDWEVELETILPGQRAGVAENEIRRV